MLGELYIHIGQNHDLPDIFGEFGYISIQTNLDTAMKITFLKHILLINVCGVMPGCSVICDGCKCNLSHRIVEFLIKKRNSCLFTDAYAICF